MATDIKGYPSKNSGGSVNQLPVTVTEESGNKVALDVSVKSGTVSTTAADAPADNPNTGDTIHLNGSVGASNTPIPAVAGGVITQVLIECVVDQASTNKLYISFDGGTLFKTLAQGSSMTWTPRGGLTQLVIKGNVAAVDYEILMNRNP
jgi:hypothetical protein